MSDEEVGAVGGVLPTGLAEHSGYEAGPQDAMPPSLDEWQKMFVQIFSARNAFMSPATIWLRAVEHMGIVAEAVRKHEWWEFEEGIIPDLLAWMIAFANKVGITLSDAVWNKYPGLCPYCAPNEREELDRLQAKGGAIWQTGHGRAHIWASCTCRGTDYAPYRAQKVERFRDLRERAPESLADWQAMFDGVYGKVHRDYQIDAIADHLHEEISEVAKEIRLERYQQACDEVADAFSWTLCLASRIGWEQRQRRVLDAEALLWRTYPGRCKVCGAPQCLGEESGCRSPRDPIPVLTPNSGSSERRLTR